MGGRSPAGRPLVVFTVGHGARPIDAYLSILRAAEIEGIVDVRTYPGSRRHPHFGRDALAASLAAAEIAYRWAPELGGFRTPRPDSRHTALRHEAFRGYADHMESEEFRGALDALLADAASRRTAAMCSESLWWRCHRRLLADAVVARGHEVRHVMEGGRTEPHRLTDGGRIDDGALVYDVAATQEELLPPGS